LLLLVVCRCWAHEEESEEAASVRHRRLNQDRWWCPSNSIYHCDDPDEIIDDSTVYCDWDTCEWDLDRLSPDAKPQLCRGIMILPEAIDTLPDTLEPCLLWEMLYGALQPTAAPTISTPPTPAPTTRKFILKRTVSQESHCLFVTDTSYRSFVLSQFLRAQCQAYFLLGLLPPLANGRTDPP